VVVGVFGAEGTLLAIDGAAAMEAAAAPITAAADAADAEACITAPPRGKREKT
jgi:hypothetical protein